MSKRPYCPRCQYPLSVCLCDSVCQLECEQAIIILQHPKETKHSKNTGRLVSLCHQKCQLLIGEQPADFAHLQEAVERESNQYALFYPSHKSSDFEVNFATLRPKPQKLIFIDATWRKAYRIFQLNPWLKKISNWHFSSPPEGRYRIRKTSVDKGLSSLEAVAYALALGYQVNTSPLLAVFEALQAKRKAPNPTELGR